MLLVFGAGFTVNDYISSRHSFPEMIERNASGQGSKTEEFEVQVEDEEKITIGLEVAESYISGEDTKEMFERVEKKLNTVILGENESLDHVEKDLKLVTSLDGEPVRISWELDDYSVMMATGELIQGALESYKDGVVQGVYATITYTEDETRQERYSFFAHLYKPTLSGREAYIKKMQEFFRNYEKEAREEEAFALPGYIDDKKITYYKNMDKRGIVLIFMAPVMLILFTALEKQKIEEAEKERKNQMIRDYSELLMRLTIFIGAGMTAKRAWRQIVKDYELQKPMLGTRFAYEEMLLTCNEMDSGVTEGNSYLNFGRRCNTQEYIRFSAILSQNLRKGTRGLTEILRTESIQAMEERKANARRLGEEAGTKLLLPMFLMLAIVLVIVMVPALMSIQI